ncbi:ABC transporter ATP-binding protein [Propionibacteriaceae bacterium G1746]|uniref:ABC transporter ATP-binding protein n=1 Tax=Aestuariimicrobium sp. G57 TaxID=3418485 RepID=UPI003C181472
MRQDIQFLWGTFARPDQVKLIILAAAQFVLALFDLIGLAAVLPLMQVMLGADLESGYIGVIYRAVGEPTRTAFVLLMAGLMVAAFALKAAASLLFQWWSSGVILRLQIQTSTRLLDAYLSEDYISHRRRTTAEMLRTLDAAVAAAHGQVLGSLLGLLSSGLSILLILGLLLAITPTITIAALVYFGVAVYLIQRVLARRNTQAGEQAVMSSWAKSLALINAISGFREVRMHDAKDEFLTRFREASEVNAAAGRRALVYSSIPKQVLELTSITGIALILALVLLFYDPSQMVPTLTVFVAATVRLLPVMSGLTTTLGTIRSGRAGLRLAVGELQRLPEQQSAVTGSAHRALGGQASATPSTLEVQAVSFRYPDGNHDVLRDINLVVPPGTSLALCGSSGSGKTTLVDIMLGLIPITRGTVTYGGESIDDLDAEWRAQVAYVPQDVFVINDTLAANIAFGESPQHRDEARIRDCLERARLGDVLADLPEGLDSLLGERGSRLSGGQRQRIGIARALYRRPSVIVLDEATSALDNETEDQISRTIHDLNGQITAIIVAHRLSTVRHVDQLAFLEDGRVTGLGTFTEVRDANASFARMVELGRLDDDAVPSGTPAA